MPADIGPTNCLERIVPELLAAGDVLGQATLQLHLARYEFAARWVSGRTVLDLACGSGYGSALLMARGAAHVVGVDISPEAIAYARATHARPGIDYICASAETFAPERPFDVAVSLETIEHVTDPAAFLRRLASFVRPAGMVIGSVPTTLSSDVNPYHLHDFTPGSLRSLFASAGLHISDELTQKQRVVLGPLLRGRGGDGGHFELRRGLARYYVSHPGQALRRARTLLTHGLWNEYLVVAATRT